MFRNIVLASLTVFSFADAAASMQEARTATNNFISVTTGFEKFLNSTMKVYFELMILNWEPHTIYTRCNLAWQWLPRLRSKLNFFHADFICTTVFVEKKYVFFRAFSWVRAAISFSKTFLSVHVRTRPTLSHFFGDVPKLRKISRFPNFGALKLWKCRSGSLPSRLSTWLGNSQ